MIAENSWRDAAAVASRRAGELYGLELLDEDIQVNGLWACNVGMESNLVQLHTQRASPGGPALPHSVPY